MLSQRQSAVLAGIALLSCISMSPGQSSANVADDGSIVLADLSNNRANRQLRRKGGLENPSEWGHRYRSYPYYYNDDGDGYWRNRGFGIHLNLNDGAGGCGYAYQQWQYTGSPYWRSRYYDCAR